MKINRKAKREKAKADLKAAKKHYRENRELGPCYVDGCENNGDFKMQCVICESCVQSCTEHHKQGRDKVKRHLMLKHPAQTLPTVIMGVLRGQSLE